MTVSDVIADDATQAAPVLEAASLKKSFGGIQALHGVDLVLRPGEVHGLLGQNGSGKSTLLKVLGGQIEPDGGELRLDGRHVRFANPAQALKAGIAVVSQELCLAPDLSVAENVCLADRPARAWHGVPWKAMSERATAVLDLLGLPIDPATPLRALRPDQRQLVEIGRAVSTNARVLILDEPSSSLDDDAASHLFALVRTLRNRGVAIVLVTHRTPEIFSVVDVATVLRDGRAVAAGIHLANLQAADLVRLMTGADASQSESCRSVPINSKVVTGNPALSTRNLAIPGTLAPLDLTVASGEVVGVAGLTGSGRSELLGALFGLIEREGDVAVGGVRLGRRTSPRRSMRAGVGYVPADRAGQGLFLPLSLRTNILAPRMAFEPPWKRPKSRQERADVGNSMRSLGIVPPLPEQPVGAFSGGNQQKALLAKWLLTGSSQSRV